AEDRAEEEDQVEAGDQDDVLGKTHDEPVPEPPEVAGQAAQEEGNEEGDRHTHEPDCQGDPGAIQQPAEDVPAEVVRAEQEYRFRPGAGVRVPVSAEEMMPEGNETPEL